MEVRKNPTCALAFAMRRSFPHHFSTVEHGFRIWQNRLLVSNILKELRQRGHRVKIAKVSDKIPSGDIGILHCDCSIIPPEYANVSKYFPYTINGSVLDITKRAVSQASLVQSDRWDGPVIMKTNYNAYGVPEFKHNRQAAKKGHVAPHVLGARIKNYQIFENMSQVPPETWKDLDFTLERFIPEVEDDGYAVRTWTFWGDQERCRRHVSTDKFVKGKNLLRSENSDVPKQLRETRRKLGFDYGKFDFVVHEGEPVLFDANKTPGNSPKIIKKVMLDIGRMADGFESFLK